MNQLRLLRSNAVIIVRTQQGMGDNFYAYPVVKALAKKLLHGEKPGTRLAVQTPWWQLYEESTEIEVVRRTSGLRTQAANLDRKRRKLPEVTGRTKTLKLDYASNFQLVRDGELSLLSLVEASAEYTKAEVFEFPLPDAWKDDAGKWLRSIGITGDFVLAHYPTHRMEWLCKSRSPEPGLMAKMVTRIAGDLPTLSIGWACPPKEWFAEQDRPATHRAEAGEAPFEVLTALTQMARCVVSSISYTVPMTLAVGGRLFMVYGGHVAPHVVLDERMLTVTESMPDRVGMYVAPDPFCHCVDNSHRCEKHIDLDRAYEAADAFKRKIGI